MKQQNWLQKLVKSIQEDGLDAVGPVFYNAKTGKYEIIFGASRIKNAKELPKKRPIGD